MLKDELFKVADQVCYIEDETGNLLENEEAVKAAKESGEKLYVNSLEDGGREGYGTIKEFDKRAQDAKRSFTSNRNLAEACNMNYETWFNCKSYYLVDRAVFILGA